MLLPLPQHTPFTQEFQPWDCHVRSYPRKKWSEKDRKQAAWAVTLGHTSATDAAVIRDLRDWGQCYVPHLTLLKHQIVPSPTIFAFLYVSSHRKIEHMVHTGDWLFFQNLKFWDLHQAWLNIRIRTYSKVGEKPTQQCLYVYVFTDALPKIYISPSVPVFPVPQLLSRHFFPNGCVWVTANCKNAAPVQGGSRLHLAEQIKYKTVQNRRTTTKRIYYHVLSCYSMNWR